MENVEKLEQQNKKHPDKLTDKAFLRLAVTSVLAILFCIICLCSTTFAWFSDSAPSAGNEIKTANDCKLEVTVVNKNSGEALQNIENGVELVKGESYEVTLSLPGNTASGYCVIKTADGAEYYTDYILRHEGATPVEYSFILSVEETQTVSFTPRWGIFSRESDLVEISLVETTPDEDATTEDATTEDVTTEDETAEDETTENEPTEDETTEDETTEGATPEDEITEGATPEDEPTEDVTPEDETTEDESTTEPDDEPSEDPTTEPENTIKVLVIG